MDSPVTYAFVLLFGVILTGILGQVLIRSGKAFLEDCFGSSESAASMSRLLGILFYLIVLGVLALLSIMDLGAGGAVQTVIAKVGVVLLVLGIAHGGTMLALIQLRNRRREQAVADELYEQAEVARTRQQEEHQPDREHQPPPVSGGPSVRSP